MSQFCLSLLTARFRAVLWVSLTLGLICGLPAHAAKGDKEYKAGQKAETQENYDEALTQYQKALLADPDNIQYQMATHRARFQAGVWHVQRAHKLRDQGQLQEALLEYELAYALDPSNPTARQEVAALREQLAPPPSSQLDPSATEQQAPATPGEEPQIGMPPLEEAQGPPQLQPLSLAPINLRISNDSKVVFETIARLAGINALFDPDYVSKPVTVELNNVTLEEALGQVALLTKTFWKVVTQNTILVIPDTAVKRREQEQQVIKTFYISNTITPQELTEVVTAIRTLLETRRIQQINSMNAIIIRDTPDKVAIAEKIIRDIDKARPEVVVDVAVLEVRRDRSRQLGLFPVSGSTTGIQLQGKLSGGLPLSTADFSVTTPTGQLNLLLSDSRTKILQRPEVRASDGQKATLRIGDRIPIATGAFQPGVAGQVVSALVQTQFQFTDVGVNLDITPKVHTDGEITLKVRVEISAVTQQVDIGGIRQPIIGQRVIEHDIRLREGEVNILGGILQTQNTKTVTGIPGLSQIPLIKYLFSNVNDTIAEDEVLIVLRPHAIRIPAITDLNRRALDVGTEGDIRLRTPSAAPEAPAPDEAEEQQDGARLQLPATEVPTQPGEIFEVSVQIENARDVFSVPFELSYDPTIVKLVKIGSGGFLGQNGQPVAVVERTDEPTGRVSVTLTRPPGTGGASGDGTLAILRFQRIQEGPARLSIASTGMHSAAQRQVFPP
ncbi:MAG: hypothetical protein HY649_06385 [Acidobacteria bacterium]|nr:hypothetical protein [Acidobacteriota bacterium]